MLHRFEHDHGVVTYQSPGLRERGVVHAFTTRLGGVSTGPYATLNLGSLEKGGGTDANTHVAENFRRLRSALDVPRRMRMTVRQVHGGEVWQPPVKPIRPADTPEADALISDQPHHLLTIRIADCAPVLLASEDGCLVAAVHVGWRGLIAGVIENATRALHQHRAGTAGGLHAAVGPCIGVDSFEVGPEVARRFDAAGLGAAVAWSGVESSTDRPHVDLRQAVRQRLEGAGIRPARIDLDDLCTYRNEAEFFSHRRDTTHRGSPSTGRLAAVISPRADE